MKTTLLSSLAALCLLIMSPLVAAAAKVVNVTTASVVGDGTTLNTINIQRVIDDCSAAGGGIVSFPAGRYLTGTIQIKNNVTLQLEEGATLLGSTDAAHYLNLDPFVPGHEVDPMGYALIVAVDASNVGIEGKGTVDGQSPALKKKQNPYAMRPFLVRWVRCTNVTVKDVHLTNPGAWTLNFFQTKGVVIENVTIRSRDLGMANNDGIDIDSCENVRVRDCDVVSGDDALVIKATSRSKPCRDVEATNCKLSTRCNAIKLGTESIGGFENIRVSHCSITDTKMAGIALFEVDGADLQHVTISDITMDGVIVPICIRLGARLSAFRQGDQPRPRPGTLRDITIENVSAKNIAMIGVLISGVSGFPVEKLTLKNIQLELPGGGTTEDAKVQPAEMEKAYPEFDMFGKILPAYGIYARHVQGVEFENVRMNSIKPDARPAVVFVDVENVKPVSFANDATRSK